jgi:hypothetical protein
MRTVVNAGHAALLGAALLLAASLPARSQSADEAAIDDTDSRVACMEGAQERAETPPAATALPPPTAPAGAPMPISKQQGVGRVLQAI